MKATTFIEAVNNRIEKANEFYNRTSYFDLEIDEIEKLATFYSQPFDVAMLFNPTNEPDEYDYTYPEAFAREAYNRDCNLHYESNSKVLFEGIGVGITSIYYLADKWVYKLYTSGEFYLIGNSHISMPFPLPNTLNDFISDCARCGIELTWNNNAIKKLGL